MPNIELRKAVYAAGKLTFTPDMCYGFTNNSTIVESWFIVRSLQVLLSVFPLFDPSKVHSYQLSYKHYRFLKAAITLSLNTASASGQRYFGICSGPSSSSPNLDYLNNSLMLDFILIKYDEAQSIHQRRSWRVGSCLRLLEGRPKGSS